MKVILIDSGVDTNHPAIKSESIKHANTKLYMLNSMDTIGHGTAIAFILQQELWDSEIISYKLFEEDYYTGEDEIFSALCDIYDNYEDVGIIVLSSGTNYLKSRAKFEEICVALKEKGIILVAGYDNSGSVSYPAAFDSVIGVYWDKNVKGVHEFYYVENSSVEILGYAGNQKLPWKNGTYKYVAGSSFVVPHIACIIEKYQRCNPQCTIEDVRSMLKASSKKVFYVEKRDYNYQKRMKEKIENIHNAIVFPCNKEIEALIGNTDLLEFELVGIYDVKYSTKIYKKADEVIFCVCKNDMVIYEYNQIEWESDNFDTIIVGHLNIIKENFQLDYMEDILKKAYKHNKNVVSLDEIDCYEKYINKINKQENFAISLQMSQIETENNCMGSLYKIASPMLGVVGTGKQQGKYNVQLMLRRKLMRDGYSVGQLGTEPTAHLFGMDISWPVGYGSNINQGAYMEISCINKELFGLSEKEIIVIGIQSQTIPYDFGNLGFLTLHQENILIASNPDGVILCVNYDDEISYIKRTIAVLKNYYMTEVIAICVYPIHKELYWNINAKKSSRISKIEEEKIKENLRETHLPVFINGNEQEMEDLYSRCLAYFSGEEC